MSTLFRIYGNIDYSGWTLLDKTKDKMKMRSMLIDLLHLDVPAEVIVKYRQNDTDMTFCRFYNRTVNRESLIYRIDNHELNR